MGEKFERAGWRGAGLMRARPGDWADAMARGVLVIPAGEDGSLISATPPLAIPEDVVDDALERLA
jgi:acetylornithine/succinyldiaminopimelate/putrescine aminotransferase